MPGAAADPSTLSSASVDAVRILNPHHGRLKRLLRDLVRCSSVAAPPSGNETPAQEILRGFFEECGLRPELYDTGFLEKTGSPFLQPGRRYKGRKNLAASIHGSGRGKSLLLNGHMDTVPPGRQKWSQSPWSGSSQGSRIYGLGSFDMKGGMVAQAAVLCAINAAKTRLGGDLRFESVVDEEWGGGGGTLAARIRHGGADACLIAEGTQLEIYRGTRGGFVVDLISDAGDPSAYFSNEEVISPALHLGRLIGWVEELARTRKKIRPRGAYADFPDPAPVQVLAIESNRLDPDVPLSVPSHAVVRVYLQFLPEESPNSVLKDVRRSLREFEQHDRFFKLHPIVWKPVLGKPLRGHELPLDHPWTRCLAESAQKLAGRPPVVTAAPYPCDAGLIDHHFKIPVLLFGPCGAGAHNPDEYVEFDSVLRAAEVMIEAALRWCNA